MTSVYFAQAGDARGAIKIGISGDVKKRLESLQTGNHLPIRLLASFEHAHAARIESELHALFADCRLEGEWFRCDDRIFEAIQAWRQLNENPTKTSCGLAIPSRLHDRLRQTKVRDALHRNEWCVVEWSERQGFCHVTSLIGSLSMTHESLLFGRFEPNDYVIIAIVETYEDADAIAAAMEPWLKTMRAMRRVLANPRTATDGA